MRKVTHSIPQLLTGGGENCTTGLMCFCFILQTMREQDSSVPAVLLGSHLVSLYSCVASHTSKIESERSYKSKYSSIYKLSSGLKGK